MTRDAKTSSDFSFEDVLSKARKVIFWVGAVMSVLGGVALAMPMLSTLVVETFVGWLLTTSGIVSIAGAFALRGTGLFFWGMMAGLLTVVVGVFLLLFPAQGIVALTLVVAVVLFMTGVAQAAFAFWIRPAAGWAWGAVSALVSILLGAFIIMTFPEASAVVLGVLVGFDFLSTGVAFVLIARSAKSAI